MMGKQYRAIIFDLDGTLIDNQASFVVAYQKLCDLYPTVLKKGSDEQRERLVRLHRVSNPQAVFDDFTEKYSWRSAPSFSEYWKIWLKLYTDSAIPFPDSADTLSYLKERGYRIGMITNGDSSLQRAKLSSSGLLPYFDHVIVSGEEGIDKPNPLLYERSADALGVSLSECLFVGDRNETDIAGAKNAGMDSFLVGAQRDLLGATYKATHLSALKEILTVGDL